MKYKIYKLVYNDNVIYVGYTKRDIRFRFNERYNNKHIPIEIIKNVKIELIEETDDKSREEYWRLYYINLGFELYNMNKGDGVFDMKKYNYNHYREKREMILEYKKNYYKEKREMILEYKKNYYKEKNRI